MTIVGGAMPGDAMSRRNRTYVRRSSRSRVSPLMLCLVALLALAMTNPPASAGSAAAPPRADADPQESVPDALDAGRQRLADAAAARAATALTVPGSLLVSYDDSANETVRGGSAERRLSLAAEGAGVDQVRVGAPLAPHVRRVQVPPGEESAAAAAMAQVPGVVAVEPDRRLDYLAEPNDPAFSEQWPHVRTDAPQAWNRTTGSPAVRVAVIDAGIDATLPDLADVVVEQLQVSNGEARVTAERGGTDNDTCDLGHGTWVAGVLGARGDNGIGVAGVAWNVGIVDIGFASCEAGVAESDAIAGLQAATERNVDIVNMSFGGPALACGRALQSALDSARDAGILVVAASGNNGRLQASVPAGCRGVIGVGATARSGRVADYSTRSPYLDLVAPGGSSEEEKDLVLTVGGSPCPRPDGEGLCRVTGTSFAAPYVAGVAALIRAARPATTPDELEALLETTAVHPDGAERRDDTYGWGEVRTGAAVTRATPRGEDLPAPREETALPVGIGRLAAPDTPTTDAVSQAIAASQLIFDNGGASYAVLARRDDYADALAGSTLSYGFGPILYTSSAGALDPRTGAELRRTVAKGGVVYLLGGPAALPTEVDDELARLGYRPVRLAGAAREETARLVGEETRRLLPALGIKEPRIAILATRGDWPDAVAAGSLGATFGIPILLTAPDVLHPATQEALQAWQPDLIYVVGGEGVVSAQVASQAQAAAGAGTTQRLAGATRFETAAAVATETREILALVDQAPRVVFGVNLRRADGYAHVLSAAPVIAVEQGVFLGVEGEDGDTVPVATADASGRLSVLGAAVVGGPDVVTERTRLELASLLRQ